MKLKLPALLVILTLGLSAAPPHVLRPIKLLFWAKPGARKDPRVISVEPHELCSGDLATCRVTEIPRPTSDKALEPHIAFELTPEGKVINRWAIPVEYLVVGIRGNDLMLVPTFGEFGNRLVVVSRNRHVHTETGYDTLPPSKPQDRDYPSLGRKLEGNQVGLFLDTKSGSYRAIAFPEPCT